MDSALFLLLVVVVTLGSAPLSYVRVAAQRDGARRR
jgi:hypothetical protein